MAAAANRIEKLCEIQMVINFTSRPKCLICGENASFSLYKASFGKGETWEFLRTYYKGRLDQEKVNDGIYELK